MSGLLSFSVAGLAFLLISLIELLPFSSLFPSLSSSSSSFLPLRLRFLSSLSLSLLSLLSSLLSFFLSSSHDPLSPSLTLSSAAAASLFLLYSLSGILSLPPSPLLPFPSSLLDLLLTFAFGQEFLIFYLRRKDVDGIENRYFDLLLVPILLCIFSTMYVIARPRAVPPRLARAAGLALQGTWFLQMGFSFFTSAIAHECQIHERSRADYTIKCKSHEDYHRARAIATLQFNCHLALLIVVGVGVYGVVMKRRGGVVGGYRPLNKEVQMGGVVSQFTLDSDEEGEIVAEANGSKEPVVSVHVAEENGF
ncbi:uncharacterized protein [Typha angustifolia]|uniref:uncharacterized protein n=1 Tax=Typha angustifolia TaxID=59011 RepID=UPI003C2C7320